MCKSKAHHELGEVCVKKINFETSKVLFTKEILDPLKTLNLIIISKPKLQNVYDLT